MPRDQTPVIPQVVAAEPAVVAEQVAAEEVVDALNVVEASASNVTADADELMPPPPAFVVPPMDWLLGGPSAGWLVDDPERNFDDEELTTPTPDVYLILCFHNQLIVCRSIVFLPCMNRHPRESRDALINHKKRRREKDTRPFS